MSSPNPRWQVLGKRTEASPWQLVGEVHAPEPGLALLLAKESFFRHREGVRLAVRPRDAADTAEPEAGAPAEAELVELDPPDLLQPATDKSYRLQTGYAGLGQKRRKVMEQVRADGRRITRPRPVDRRKQGLEGADV